MKKVVKGYDAGNPRPKHFFYGEINLGFFCCQLYVETLKERSKQREVLKSIKFVMIRKSSCAIMI